MRVADLSEPLQSAIGHQDLIVFDGVCVLCTGFFRFMAARDRRERFRFATAQGALGQELYHALDLPTDEFETNLVIVDGQIHRDLDAFIAAMRALGAPWSAARTLSLLPRSIQIALYRTIARNRYRIFGRIDTCMMPTPELRARFVEGL